MKISLEWLNSYLDRSVAADEAERILTAIGFPLEGVEDQGEDAVLDVEVTSNRGDCLSHIGIARELAAATGRRLREPEVAVVETGREARTLASVENRDLHACPLYTARVITGVKVMPSPPWLAARIEAIGLRPINNIVDVTNFVLHEMGQPLHAFDLARLDGRRIIVRPAQEGEQFTAIDTSRHLLAPPMLVIADARVPQAIAGVMGGAASEVTDQTVDVLLESAQFDPLSVRTTSRALRLASDSSYRFERGVDPAGVDRASRRAAQLIVELAGGTLAPGVIMAGEPAIAPRIVPMRPERCSALLGYRLPVERMVQWLAALGLTPELEGDCIHCTIPTHRRDLAREVDLIEEIARLHGYEHIPVEPKMRIVARPPQKLVQVRQTVARVLTAHGFLETINFSFLAPKLGEPFLDGRELVQVDEDKKKAEPGLRPSLLPSLLGCRKSNQDAGNKEVRLFEIAQTFGRKGDGYQESRRLALLADAQDLSGSLRAMRGTIEELLEHLGAEQIRIVPGQDRAWARPAAHLVDGGGEGPIIGAYGPATPAMLKLFDLQTPVVLAEIDYEPLIRNYPPRPRVGPLPRFPAIERDLSLIVDEPVTWEEVDRLIARTRPALLEAVEFVTVYRGKPIAPGRKSVTLRMTFRDPQRTLKHEEVNPQVQAVVDSAARELNAEVRTG